MTKGPVIITGSRGFLARALAAETRRLRPGARLILVDHKPHAGHSVCELTDPRAVKSLLESARPSLIFHLAGTTRVAAPRALWDAHVGTTINILEAVRGLPEGRRPLTVLAGSAAEYGQAASLPITEQTPARPVNAYGASKWCQTLAALSFTSLGVPVSVARIFNLLGPGTPEHLAPGSFARQFAAIALGMQKPLVKAGNLAPKRDYLDVRDAARGLLAIADAPQGVYNVCSGRSHAVRELVGAYARLSGVRARIEAEAGRRRRRDVPDSRGSRAKLSRVSGWKPRISFEQSIAQTYAWHTNRLKS